MNKLREAVMLAPANVGEKLRNDNNSPGLYETPRDLSIVSAPSRLQARPAKVSKSVLLIDSHQLTLECFASWLEPRISDMPIASCTSVDEMANRAELSAATIDLVLLNLGARLVSDPRSLDEFSMLKELLPDVPVIVISDHEETQQIVDALEYGAKGYIPTSTAMSVVVGAIRLVQSGGVFIPVSALTALAQQQGSRPPVSGMTADSPSKSFTNRQSQVLACLREGKPNKLIAYELMMCESTVKVHVRHIMKKLGATNRTQVAYLTNSLFTEK